MPSYLEDDPTIDYLDDPEAEPAGVDGKPLVRRPSLAPPNLVGAPPVPRPVGAGDHPTIREIIAASQPQLPQASPDQQEMDSTAGAVKTAQQKRADVAAQQPTPQAPKWWQRALAGVAGAAAGYTNASGRVHVDPTGAINAAYGVPGQQRKMAEWQKQSDVAQQGVDTAQGNLTTLEKMRQLKTAEQRAASDEEEKRARAQKESEANAFAERKSQLAANERRDEALLKTPDAFQIQEAEKDKVPADWTINPSAATPGTYIVTPPKFKTLTEELVPYIGGKAGDQVPWSAYRAAQADLGKDTRAQNKPMNSKPELDQQVADRTRVADNLKLSGRDRMTYIATGQIHQPPAAANPQSQSDASDIAAAIRSGIQPPDLKGLYRQGAPVRAQLARDGYDLMTAQRDWQSINRHLATLNGQQQERLRQAITFTHDSIGQIEQLYDEWQKTGLPGGFKDFNKAALAAAAHLPGKQGAVAQNLMTQLNDLTSELGTVYKGGTASTDESLRLAGENLKADWNRETFQRAVKQLKTNLEIRKNSILTSQPAGVSPNSPYLPQGEAPTPTGGGRGGGSSRSSGGTVAYKSNGKTYNIPVAEEAEFLRDHKGAVKQ